MTTSIYDPLGGRRFVMCMGCGVVSTALLWWAKIDGSVFRDIILGTIGAYVAGNAFQKNSEAKYAGQSSSSDPSAG